MDSISAVAQFHRADGIDGERLSEPPGEARRVVRVPVVATGEHHDANLGASGDRQDLVGERATRMRRDDQVSALKPGLCLGDGPLHQLHTPGQLGPVSDDRGGELRRALGKPRIERERTRRGVVEDQHQMGDEPVPGRGQTRCRR